MTDRSEERALFVISVAAELAEMHPQTLRQYDRLGLVKPTRAPGRSRRYSQRDVDKLREIQRLSQEGITLEGIKRIMQLENQVAALQQRVLELTDERDAALDRVNQDQSVWAASPSGEVVRLPRGSRPTARPRSRALVVYRPRRGGED
ncbi:MerR family transcriptional regulator [Kocuria sp. JC486]|uniref:MerR family transcriptional regulator n=1 Tax=Kocuria soli TaxID=2485125 RepID=A0A3N3ZTG3_9MICC|nr:MULTISPECIES: MerR family transcriptional regulator [Kocuria]NHU85028.1 MerR family transcriptional regulator [Kocuria sp. JC486]ROZ65621.1 MerR family transcriptional regulator [Kocuria soli]